MQTGRKILNLRCDRKVSQQELAKACDITPSALSKIEAGINSPRANVLWRIARNLGVTVEYLLDEEMPYPYAGYSYRQDFLASNVDPGSVVRMDVTREEKAFLEALRKTTQVARDVAYGIPEAAVETLRMVHFLLNHSKIQNPSQEFINSFESLVTTGTIRSSQPPQARVEGGEPEAEPEGSPGLAPARRRGRPVGASAGRTGAARKPAGRKGARPKARG